MDVGYDTGGTKGGMHNVPDYYVIDFVEHKYVERNYESFLGADVADLRIHRSLFGLQKWLISNNGQGWTPYISVAGMKIKQLLNSDGATHRLLGLI